MFLPQLAHTGPTHREWNPSFACEQNNFWWCRGYFFMWVFETAMEWVSFCVWDLWVFRAWAWLLIWLVKKSGKSVGFWAMFDTWRKTCLHYTLITVQQVPLCCRLMHHVIIPFKIQGWSNTQCAARQHSKTSMWVQSGYKFIAFLWEQCF